MLERTRQQIKRFRDEFDEHQRKERERTNAPIRAAENALIETHRKLAAVMKDRLLGTVRDPDPIAIDPAVATVRMTQQQANEFNRAEFRKYKEQHPELYWDETLVDSIGSYLDANGLKIITVSMIDAIVSRYREANLLPDAPPAPELIEPEPEPAPIEAKPEAIGYAGWSLESGEPCTFSKRQVANMSADEFRRCFHLDRESLALPNVGPGGRRNL